MAEAVAVVGNRVAVVGANDEALEAAGDRAERVDLAGRAVLPGFVDAHFHLLTYSLGREQIHLGGAESLEAALDLVARAAPALPPYPAYPARLYWHLANARGVLHRYEVRAATQRLVVQVPRRLARAGSVLRVHYQGYTGEYAE